MKIFRQGVRQNMFTGKRKYVTTMKTCLGFYIDYASFRYDNLGRVAHNRLANKLRNKGHLVMQSIGKI